MIENLQGTHENVIYRKDMHMRMYDNFQNEDYPAHWHAELEIIMPLDNTYSVTINNTTHILNPNDIIFIMPGTVHMLKAPPTGRRYLLLVDLSLIKNISGMSYISSAIGQYAIFTREGNERVHQEIVDTMLSIADEYFRGTDHYVPKSMRQQSHTHISNNNLCELSIYSMIIKMMTVIGRNFIQNIDPDLSNTGKQQEYIAKFMSICDYIDEHFAENLTLEEVAQMSNFSKFHFTRLFKQFTGMTFYKYVNQKRISFAESLLQNPDTPIIQVATQSGFSSASAFIRMFRSFKGCTPTDFRKIHQQ